MDTTLQEAIDKVRAMISDPGGTDPLYPNDLLVDGVNDALLALLPWVANSKEYTVTGDGTTASFALPTDLHEIQAVHSSTTKTFIARLGLFPGNVWSAGEGLTNENNFFVEYPQGYINLSVPPLSTETITIYYTGYWTAVTDLESALEPPLYTLPAIAYYAASYALSPKATASAQIRQYNTKQDSGNPVQNPMVEMAKFFLQRFQIEVERCPRTQRGQKTS